MLPEHRAFALEQIARIDSGEASVFADTQGTGDQLALELLGDAGAGKPAGVCYACWFAGAPRVQIALAQDAPQYGPRAGDLIEAVMARAGCGRCTVWLRADNPQLIAYLTERFLPAPDCGAHFYAATEYVWPKEQPLPRIPAEPLRFAPYQRPMLNAYLTLLDRAMTFADPPPRFAAQPEVHGPRLQALCDQQGFEAAYWGDALIGLYERSGAEIDLLAVDPACQRRGWGAAILTRALEQVFTRTDAPAARLCAVDWNPRAQSFYTTYGMHPSGHSHRLCIDRRAT